MSSGSRMVIKRSLMIYKEGNVLFLFSHTKKKICLGFLLESPHSVIQVKNQAICFLKY